MDACNPGPVKRAHPESAELEREIDKLKLELASVSDECETAREGRDPGVLFFLLRKKWRLTQALFELESRRRLTSP